MKIKAGIYFLLIIAGVTALVAGEKFVQKEYAMSIGFILLMLGLYKTSRLMRPPEDEDEI
jgi:hypothetical protein